MTGRRSHLTGDREPILGAVGPCRCASVICAHNMARTRSISPGSSGRRSNSTTAPLAGEEQLCQRLAGPLSIAYGLPILSLRRVWYVLDANEPTGPHWELTFRERLTSADTNGRRLSR